LIEQALRQCTVTTDRKKGRAASRQQRIASRIANTVAIYALIDPRSEQICYVGQSNDPHGRAMQHFTTARCDKGDKSRWLMGLRDDGLKPIVCVLQDVPTDSANVAESRWIAWCLSEGMSLLNVASVVKRVTIELDQELRAALVKLDNGAESHQNVEERFAGIIGRLIIDAGSKA
jgi:hypothetical protein